MKQTLTDKSTKIRNDVDNLHITGTHCTHMYSSQLSPKKSRAASFSLRHAALVASYVQDPLDPLHMQNILKGQTIQSLREH